MAFKLENIVPWGRSYDEYVRMFSLTATDLKGAILGCGDGPASFNAGMHRQGRSVVSVDPLYNFSASEIKARIDVTCDEILRQLKSSRENYVWSVIRSPDELGRLRMAAMTEFLADFPAGKKDGRYRTGELPQLAFADQAFDLALCSHLLFLYSEQLSLDFHRQAIDELCRVAREVRIFPLVTLTGTPSPHIEPILAHCAKQGQTTTIETVPYEFQRGGNRMLRIKTPGR